MALPRVYSIAELAEAAGCSTKTVRRRISDGTLPAFKMGGRAVRIREADALSLLDPNA